MDALTHAVEAYVSTIATPVTDACALRAIELISQHLHAAVANGGDMQARDKRCYAQYLAGMTFNNASLGHVHAMAHQLGGFYDLPRGVCNAILLPHVERFNMIAKMDRFVDIAAVMGENVEGLSVLGVQEEDLKTMAENAQKHACGLANPRCPNLNDVVQIYKNALWLKTGSAPNHLFSFKSLPDKGFQSPIGATAVLARGVQSSKYARYSCG